MAPRSKCFSAGCLLAAAVALAPAGWASTGETPAVPQAETSASEKLALEQQRIRDRFDHLQNVLLRMAEMTAATDPDRAALLKKAVALSKQRLIGVQLDTVVDLLNKGSLSRAVESQEGLNQDLRAMLELLLSENRAERIQSEKERIRHYLKTLNQIIKQQNAVQGRTESGREPKSLAGEQGNLAEKTGQLAKTIQQNEESDAARSALGEAEGQPKPDRQDDAPGEGKGQGQPPAEGQSERPAQGRQSDPGPGQAEPQGPPGHPARTRLEAARRRMQEAQEKLEEAQREGAVEKQEQAIRELEQAKSKLEQILRQLREEQIERTLTMLEDRFRRMLDLQQAVYDATVRLDNVPRQDRDHDHQIEAGRLSSKEAEIVLEADKALALLREDGTAVAFPEAVQQIRDDMVQVVQRLAQAMVGQITQAVQQDIIAALGEMIDAVEKALEELEQRRRHPEDLPPTQPEDPPLVNLLAEVKMIRAMQLRVNRRTEQYSKRIDGEQAEHADLLQALDRLADRQQRIYQITRDLHLGRNR